LEQIMNTKRILIVEDETRIALALCRALEHSLGDRCEVDVTPVVETALPKLKDTDFDLLVTDLRMPGMGGLKFIRHVREASPKTRTMLITAFGSPEIQDVAQRLGAVYMPKPFRLRDFVATVKSVLNGDDESET
jgi:DNA-binding response OmpR family regulator